MKRNVMLSFITIILGLIIVICPYLGVTTLSAIIGIVFIILGLLAFLLFHRTNKPSRRILGFILAIALIIFGIILIFVPSIFVSIITFLIYIAGFILIINGILGLFRSTNSPGKYLGILNIVLGIIYVIVAYFINDVEAFGVLIGLWLVLNGVINLFKKQT